MTYQEMLNLPCRCNGEMGTIRDYLRQLLITLWREEEGFSGKRPFGNSGWQYDVYLPLIKAGLISGQVDEDGYITELDNDGAEATVIMLIEAAFQRQERT